jgi:hypothetical protein
VAAALGAGVGFGGGGVDDLPAARRFPADPSEGRRRFEGFEAFMDEEWWSRHSVTAQISERGSARIRV